MQERDIPVSGMGFYNDLAVLISFSQFFLADHIVYFTGTSDKILFCDHMLAYLQKIPVYLNICPQVSPSAPVDIKGFLNRFTDIIKLASSLFRLNVTFSLAPAAIRNSSRC